MEKRSSENEGEVRCKSFFYRDRKVFQGEKKTVPFVTSSTRHASTRYAVRGARRGNYQESGDKKKVE